jgi:hypothetical protein
MATRHKAAGGTCHPCEESTDRPPPPPALRGVQTGPGLDPDPKRTGPSAGPRPSRFPPWQARLGFLVCSPPRPGREGPGCSSLGL